MKSKFLKKIIAVAVVGTSISAFVSPNAFAVATNDFYAWQNMNSGQSNGIWKLNSGKWYFYNYSGIVQTGWIYDKGKWYYADYTGVMQTGVIQINGKIHFFSESGAMQTGNAVINGKYYSFDGNGVAVGKDIPTPTNSFDLSGSTTIPYTPQIITNEDSSPSDPNTVARDPNNLIKYNVKFKDDDGDEFSTKTIEKDTKLTLYKPTRNGYTFVEWTTKKDGDGDSYEAGESITIKKDITLYAQWKESSASDPGTSTGKVAAEDIIVTSSAGTTTVGGTLTMTAKVLPVNATEKGVTWSVSDSKVASISADGVLTAKAVGTVTVVATSKDASGAFGSTSIEVNVVAGAAITGLDGELQMGAKVTATAATTEAGAGTWTSSNKTVAEVDPTTGVVTAKAAGTTTIAYTTSTSGNVNSKVITVKAISAGAAVTGLDEALQMGVKETAKAATTESGASGWTSSNKEVATVNESTGEVKAIKAGYTTISYTKSTSGKTNLKVLEVKAAAVVPGAEITGLDVVLQMGATVTATAATTEEGAGKWKSSDPLVATVNESTGEVKAIKDGYTTISYTTSTSGKVNSKEIIVKKAAVVPTAVVSSILFTDTDTDANQIGGVVKWTAPSDVSNVTNYEIYVSTNGTTKGTNLGEVAVGTNTFTIPANTISTGVTHIAVYTKNAIGEATTGVYKSITDVVAPAAVTINTPAIAGVTQPVTGATPVKTATETSEYTAAIAWSPNDATYAGSKVYTATITITPKTGYTLTGVTQNYFTVAGATATNSADSGVVTAVFPATTPAAVTIGAGSVVGATAGNTKITGLTPTTKYVVTEGTNYYGVLAGGTLSEAKTVKTEAEALAVGLTGTEIIGLNNTKTYKVEVVAPANVAITGTAIGGVTAPVTGATPETTATGTLEYTATVAWTPTVVGTFNAGTEYKATITITPNSGYTLTGVGANQFKVAGATATNSADSGVVTAVFPATTPAAVTIGAGSVVGATAGNTKITGLTPTTKYVVTEGTNYYGVLAGGTLSEAKTVKTEAEALAVGLTGTEIIGLDNTKTYKVEVAQIVTIGAGSVVGATAGNTKITGLTPTTKYVVTEGTNYYGVLAGGTLSEAKTVKTEAEALAVGLTGTEIIGLDNTKTYKVEVAQIVTIGAGSVVGATAGNTKITGLTPTTKYVVTEGTNYYGVLAGGTLSEAKTVKTEAEALAVGLTGEEITGLDNAKTYTIEKIS